MKIHYVVGDATKPIGSGYKIIVHCCNDICAWGAGFVISLSKKWPHVEKAYRRLGKQTVLRLGTIQLVKAEENIVVCNLIGQRDVGAQMIDGEVFPPVRYHAIYEGLVRLRAKMRAAAVSPISIHMPRMGCGLAGAEWEDKTLVTPQECILSCIKRAFENMDDLDIYVYDLEEPTNAN